MDNRDIRHPQMFQMHACVSLIRKSLDRILEEELQTGLSQSMILIFIGNHPGVSQKDISENYDITPAAVSRHVDTLTQKGYISKTENQNNKREHLLEISLGGQSAMHRAMNLINQELDTLFTGITENELSLLEKIFAKFISSMNSQ